MFKDQLPQMTQNFKKIFPEKMIVFSWKRIWVIVLVLLVILGILAGAMIAYANTYQDRVLPGVGIGDVPVGGMDESQIRDYLTQMNDRLATTGITVFYKTNDKEDSFTLLPVLAADGVVVELFRMDIDQEVTTLLSYGKDGEFWDRVWAVWKSRLTSPQLTLAHNFVDRDKIIQEIREELTGYESESRDAGVKIVSIDPLEYEVEEPVQGYGFDYENAGEQIVSQLSNLYLPEVRLVQTDKNPKVLKADVEKVINRLPAVLDDGAMRLEYIDPHTRREYSWTLTVNDLVARMEVQKIDSEKIGFGLNQDSIVEYLQTKVSARINIEAEDARFEMNQDGRVVEFQGSRPGIELNLEKSYQAINDAFLQRTWHDEGVTTVVSLVVEQVEPNIKTGEVNDLGITEVLGVGISDFGGSPKNRISNIKNASRKLNGILIKPGEEFSTIKYTRPFTLEGGYLPELVIKGDEVKPEIGGGLCQIGTTLFRMAMNSGLKITMRQNHSLVVGYYNDPVNHLPGTDATVYEPLPDFRFLNDTGNSILIQTYVDEVNQELYYTLWGTNDGRKGSYTHPQVLQWIASGAPIIKETTSLAPGEKRCQHAYQGANTSFTYTRVLADGTKEDRVFTSHYRPLPEICLLGVAEKPAECVEGEEGCQSVPSTETPAEVPPDAGTTEG